MAADSRAVAAPRGLAGLTRRPWWPAAKRTLTIGFLVVVLALVANHARSVDWPAVLAALRAYPAATLAVAAALTVASHALYCSYDLIGRHVVGHHVPAQRVAGIGLVSYAFNLNLGSLVGGIALRYRFYARVGLGTDTITQVVVLSLLTNWLGYLFVGGLVFALAPTPLPPDWAIGRSGLRGVGVAMLGAAAAYLAMCALAKRRVWQLRSHEVNLPSIRIAALQLLLSSINWLLIAGVVFTLLQQKVAYPTVLGVLLVAAVAGVITHVPAGLGVLEAVFVALLAHRVPQGELLAALLAYRAIYYLVPLAIAAALFFVVDSERGRRLPDNAYAAPSRPPLGAGPHEP